MRERRKPTCSSSAPPSDTGMLPNSCAYVSSKPRRWSSGGGGRRDGAKGFRLWLISLPSAAKMSESGLSDDVGASPSEEPGPLAAVELPLGLPRDSNCHGSRKVMPSLVKALCNTSCASTADGQSE